MGAVDALKRIEYTMLERLDAAYTRKREAALQALVEKHPGYAVLKAQHEAVDAGVVGMRKYYESLPEDVRKHITYQCQNVLSDTVNYGQHCCSGYANANLLTLASRTFVSTYDRQQLDSTYSTLYDANNKRLANVIKGIKKQVKHGAVTPEDALATIKALPVWLEDAAK